MPQTLRYLPLFAFLAACGSVMTPVEPFLLDSIRWYTGEAGQVDDVRARQLLERAAEDNDPLATMWMARVYSTGRMTFPQDKKHAVAIAQGVVNEVENLANSGVVEAMFLMGTAYAEGLAKQVDPEQAVFWYRQAGLQNHTLAQHNLGNAYSTGTGIDQDSEAAVHWWRLAAEKGDAITQLRLGESYEAGRGVPENGDLAIFWYGEAASRGNSDAASALGRLRSVN